MKHGKDLLTPAQCLLRALQPPARVPSSAIPFPARHLSHSPKHLAWQHMPRLVQKDSTGRPAPFKPEDKLSVYTRDEQIQSLHVRVKHPDGSLGRDDFLGNLLARIDRETETIVQLSKPGDQGVAIVEVAKIADLRERLRAKERADREKALAQRDSKPKQIELNWAISEHDLELKLKQTEDFLAEGKKVEILLAAKKRARRATDEEAQTVLRKIRERLVDIDAKETAPMEGKVLRQATMKIKSNNAAAAGSAKSRAPDIEEVTGDSEGSGESSTMGGKLTPAAQARLAARKAREERQVARIAKAEKARADKEAQMQSG